MKSNVTRVFQLLAGVFLLLGLSSTARSQNTLMAPNMVLCSPQVETSSITIYQLYGDVLNFSVETSTTASGPTQTIWTHAGAVNNQLTVNPPKTGTYFWRVCATNPSTFTVGVEIIFSPNFKTWVQNASTLQNGTLAVVTAKGVVCGPESGFPSSNRVGMSTQVNTGTLTPVLWFDVDTDDNGDQLAGNSCTVGGFGEFNCSTTANLNDTVQEVDDGNVMFCMQNTSPVTVQISMNFVGPGFIQ
jgi:hypothetical protein